MVKCGTDSITKKLIPNFCIYPDKIGYWDDNGNKRFGKNLARIEEFQNRIICHRGCRQSYQSRGDNNPTKRPDVIEKLKRKWIERILRGYKQWNKGYTKDTHPSIAQAAKTQKETKSKMNIVAWNSGLTKETDPRVAEYGKRHSKTMLELFQRGVLVIWNKDLTKETDERIAEYGREHSRILKNKYASGELVAWSKGLTAETDERVRKQADKMRVIAVNRRGTFPRTNTSIEILLQVSLRERNIQFETDKPLLDITRVDIFIEPNICVYADGNYWHTLPGKQEKDNKLNKTLIENGYKVFRFWGSEIREDPDQCVLKILEFIKK